jgi:3-oxoacyl-[acyl-carrier protein] reductase
MNDIRRIVLVTGAARGIGRAIALTLAQPGLTIYLNDVVLGEEATRTQQEVEARGAAARLVEFDVVDAAAVNQGVDRVVKESGRLDILVNNAGITRDNYCPHEGHGMGCGPGRQPQGRLQLHPGREQAYD